jgi:O-antigen/teichoic acid export membrane protein
MRRTTGPLVVLRLAGQGGEFVAVVLLARHLGPSQFGSFSVGYLICRYLGLLGDWGASIGGTRDVAAGATDAAELVRWRQVVTLGAMALFALGCVLAGHRELVLLSFTIGARGASRDWIALGRGQGLRAGFPAAVQGVLLAVGALAPGTSGAAATLFGLVACVTFTASWVLNRVGHASRTVRPHAGWYLGMVLADQVCATADVILISLLRSTHDAGVYAAVYRFPNAWITVLGLVIAGALPWVTRVITEEPDRMAQLRRRTIGLGARLAAIPVLLMPPAWVLCPIVFGDAYRSGRVALIGLLAATAVCSLGAPVQTLYIATGNARAIATWGILTALVNVAANLTVIPTLGMAGAAGVTVVSQGMVAGFALVQTGRLSRPDALAPGGTVP